MRDILFQLMMVHGIHGLADSWKLSHRIHSPYEKSIIERTVQYIKERMKGFHDYFPCKKTNVNCNTYKNGLIYLSVIITIICLTLQSHPNILIRLHVYFSGYHWLISCFHDKTIKRWFCLTSECSKSNLITSLQGLLRERQKSASYYESGWHRSDTFWLPVVKWHELYTSWYRNRYCHKEYAVSSLDLLEI